MYIFDSIGDWHQLIDLLFFPFCLLVVSFIIGEIINRFIIIKLNNCLQEHTLSYVFAHAVKGLPVAWCTGIGLYWTVNSLKFINQTVTFLFSCLLYAVIILSLTRVVARTVSGMLDLHIKYSQDNTKATSLLSNIVSFVIYSTGIIIVMQYLGISVTPILTALGVGGMAIALGLQDTLASIFAGIYIILSKQLQIYDYVKLGNGEIGQVVDITWRFTKVRSLANNIIIVPNKNISSSTMTNYNMPQEEIAITLVVGVSYDSDLELVEKVSIEAAREALNIVEGKIDFEPVILFQELSDSSIKLSINMKSKDFLHQGTITHEAIKSLIHKYREKNIKIPYPIRTIKEG